MSAVVLKFQQKHREVKGAESLRDKASVDGGTALVAEKKRLAAL